MIHDLGEANFDALPDYDVCVIGSGPAGATIANELSDMGMRLCVLESGRLWPTPLGHRLQRVQSEGIAIRENSRERVFGGTSTTWTGTSAPLDAIDLAPRPWLRHSGWPISDIELREYYEEAALRYRFPSLDHFQQVSFREHQPCWRSVEEKVFLIDSHPQNFGKEFRHVFAGPGTDLYLDATVVRLEASADRSAIDQALIHVSEGRELRLHADIFVLAAGGLENARLLLVSRDLCSAGLGNDHDQVGRFLMNHPKGYHGTIRLEYAATASDRLFSVYKGSHYGYVGLRLRDAIQADRGLLNSYASIQPVFPWTDSVGLQSLLTLTRRAQALLGRDRSDPGEEAKGLASHSEEQRELVTAKRPTLFAVPELTASTAPASSFVLAINVLKDARRVAQYAWARIFTRSNQKVRVAHLSNYMEMEPDPENRVVLTSECDEYGVPMMAVRHRSSELDRRSVVELHRILAEEFAALRLASLETTVASADPWPIDEDAHHHMGTTRMGTNPASSVVDPNLRLHGVPNVYVAGPSVFPTSGCANPTLTIVALSIRLARHLRAKAEQHQRNGGTDAGPSAVFGCD
jgi:choline dehydrogenase-like flavoprotein